MRAKIDGRIHGATLVAGLCLCLMAHEVGAETGRGSVDAGRLIHRQGEARGKKDLLAGLETLERKALIREVLERNPRLAAARQAWQAAAARLPQVGSLADPTVSYAAGPLSIGTAARYAQVVRLAQRLPFPGRLRLREEVAAAEAEASSYGYQALRLRLGLMASLLFDDYFVVGKSLEINDDHLQLLESFKRIATARYAAGLASKQDPLQAEVELARLEHQRIILESELQVRVAQMNALLHRSPESPLPPPPQSMAAPQAPPGDASRLQDQALANRPDLRGSAALVRARRSAIDLERRDAYPDFDVWSSYSSMWNTTEHRWLVGVQLNVPIWRGRVRAAVAEARARLARAEYQRAGREDDARSEVRQAWLSLDEAHHVLELYGSRLLPAAHDQVEAALSGYETGRNSFVALIDAEKNQRTVELEHQQALANAHSSRARLDHTLGQLPVPLTGAPDTAVDTVFDGGSQ